MTEDQPLPTWRDDPVQEAPEPERAAPTWAPGPYPFTVAIGLLFVGLAAFAIGASLGDWELDWSIAAPVIAIASGLLLAAAGAASALRRVRDSAAG